MSIYSQHPEYIITYPMGPMVREYLGLSSESDLPSEPPSKDHADLEKFTDYFHRYSYQNKVSSFDQLVDLVEELVKMKLPALAINLYESNSHYSFNDHPRGLITIGSALMMESDLEEAYDAFVQAHQIAPTGPAPLNNLAEISYSTFQDDEALVWTKKALEVSPNNQRLWELFYSILKQKGQADYLDEIERFSNQLNSYVGMSLYCLLTDPKDQLLLAQKLEDLYATGLRDETFLIAYTASLGLAGQFEKIPPILWEAQMLGLNSIPWHLYAHTMQAYLAMDKKEEALALLEKLQNNPSLSQSEKAELLAIFKEEESQ